MHRKYAIPLIGAGALLIAAAFQVASADERAAFDARYSQVNSWSGGLVGVFTVSNRSAEAASDWKLSFGLRGDAKVTGVWNGTLSVSDGTYTIKPHARSRTLAAHSSIEVGLTASANTPVTPIRCTVNGKSCQLDAASSDKVEAPPPGPPDLIPARASGSGEPTSGKTGASASGPAGASTTGATGATGATTFAPYVYLPAVGRPPLDAIAAGSGATTLTLSSLLPSTRHGCDLKWGGTTDLGAYAGEITKALRTKLGIVAAIGVGGSTDLAKNCGNAATMEAALRNVLDLGVRNVDLTIPGGLLGDGAANALRAQAIKDLQARFPDLKVSYILPAVTGGRYNPLDALVKPLAAAKSAGAVVDRVNILPVDLGSPADPIDALLGGAKSVDAVNALISTATGLHEKIMEIHGIDAAAAWRALGVVPVIGGNDLLGKTALAGNVGRLVAFAKANGVGLVGFLPVDVAGGCGSGDAGAPNLSAPVLNCLDLSILPHFFEISDIFGRAAR